jgi:hypothetical protein
MIRFLKYIIAVAFIFGSINFFPFIILIYIIFGINTLSPDKIKKSINKFIKENK